MSPLAKALAACAVATGAVAAAGAGVLWWISRPEGDPPARFACHAGAWRAADGRILVMTPLEEGLRYRLPGGEVGKLIPEGEGRWSGTRGWTGAGPESASASVGECGADSIGFALAGEASARFERLRLERTETVFRSGETLLAGRLVMPAGGARVPVAVLVHGSERYSGRAFYHEQHMFPAHGIGVFVYDKRGTGGSEGRYTQDFPQLARDAAAAVAEARRIAGTRASRVGLLGSSQGGWIAPLAATLAPVDFVVAAYGMLEGPLAEDAGEVRQSLLDKGHGEVVLARAREVTDATGAAIATGFRQHVDRIAEVKRRYGAEPWFGDMRGDFTHRVLRAPPCLLPWIWRFFDVGTSWNHDPMAVQRALRVPQLWVLAGRDSEAPHEETLRRLEALRAEGRPIAVALFPHADHGILEFEEKHGERLSIRYSEGYFALVMDWIRDGRLGPAYGRAELRPAPAAR